VPIIKSAGVLHLVSELKGLPVQSKLAVSRPRDIYEQEADRAADQVMSAPDHSMVGDAPLQIQRFAGPSNGQVDRAPASVDEAIAAPASRSSRRCARTWSNASATTFRRCACTRIATRRHRRAK
jgi:hypothetical protein